MRTLAVDLGILNCDYLVVTDGSGMVINKPCGWASRVCDLRSGETWSFYGGNSGGTNNYAELEPIVYSLWRIRNKQEKAKVSIVSDSEITVRCGSGIYERKANGHLWAALEWFEKNGFVLDWRHVPRNSNSFNADCDKAAGLVRRIMESFNGV